MQLQLIDVARGSLALGAGGMIGYAFGLLQRAALLRNELRERRGEIKNGWSLMPGAGARVAYLLLALALVQFLCPLLFVEGTQWVVSAGVVLGYGVVLVHQLRRRLKGAR